MIKLTDEDINSIIGDIDTDAPAPLHKSEARLMFAKRLEEIRGQCDTKEEFQIAVAEEYSNLRPLIEPTYRANPEKYAFMLECFDLYDKHHNKG